MIGSMKLGTISWNRAVRVVVRCVAVGAVLFGVAGVSCHAKEMCPWINEQTAAGFLKGDVTTTVTHASTGADKAAVAAATVTGISATIGDATCEFVHRDASGGVTRLRIEVVTMGDVAAAFPAYRGRCGTSGQPVRAIGNEAEVCTMAAGRGAGMGVGEQVVSRVRDRAFVVSIAAGAGTDQATLRETTLRVAEQVAGFLF
jgi:hypothetical protein